MVPGDGDAVAVAGGAGSAAGPSVGLAAAVFAVHAALRFAGAWQPALVPLSMAIVWPLPWLLLDRDGRGRIGIRRPRRRGWIGIAGLAGVAALAACAAVAWLIFGDGGANWLVLHGQMLQRIRSSLPPGLDAATTFWLLTAPALLFSPLGEEILYRGFLQEACGRRWGASTGLLLQAAAFGLVHLAHYGLDPPDPALIAVWVPSMFAVALLLGWLTLRYESLAPPVLAHAAFNLAMSWTTLRLLPALSPG